MATPKSQRIVIWVIAIVLTLGTLMSFLVIALSMQNQKTDTEKATAQQEEQQKLIAQMQAANAEPLTGYSARTFDAAAATELKVEVLVEGSGEVIKATDKINSSYFGWTSDGKIFDSSKKKGSDDAPIAFSLTGVITGWTEGLTGQKVGSVVRLTIPSDKAYGAKESGAIPANSPLEFIVQIHNIDNSTSTDE